MQNVSVSELMAKSGVTFGTSGARGLVSAMTDLVCFTYTCAFLQHLAVIGQFAPGKRVAIAGDLRPSTPRIIAACAAAVRHMGGEVDYCGFVPSPAVAGYGFSQKIPSLMVTGSHIPDDRNGIKFNRTDGEVLKPDEIAMRAQVIKLPDLFDHEGMLRSIKVAEPAIDVSSAYVARYTDFFGPLALVGLRLGVYEHSAVGRDILVAITEALGAHVIRLARSDKFVPVDTEAVRPEDHTLARLWAAELNIDAILSTDGDSDRPLLADENGEWMRGDVLGILCAQGLRIAAVATPISSNSALELSGAFSEIRRTRIGSPYVIEAMKALSHSAPTACGYEANGGFILGSEIKNDQRVLAALPTRDAMLPMLVVLAEICRRKVPLSALQLSLPSRYTFSDRLQNYPTSESHALIDVLTDGSEGQVLYRLTQMFQSLSVEAASFSVVDGLRITFECGDVIHLRPSGNAPELRCYTESYTHERAEHLNGRALAIIEAGVPLAKLTAGKAFDCFANVNVS